LIVLLAASTVLWLPYLLQSDLALFARLLAGGEDESSMERLLLQSNAIGLFMQSPLIGSAFAEFELDTYPHNVFIETAMALGVVGLVALAWALKDGIRGLRSAPHRQSLLLAMVFVQYLCAFQFSGAIYGSAVFWATLAWFSAVRKRAPGRRPTHEVLPMASRS
jgi:O-antigen ligase